MLEGPARRVGPRDRGQSPQGARRGGGAGRGRGRGDPGAGPQVGEAGGRPRWKGGGPGRPSRRGGPRGGALGGQRGARPRLPGPRRWARGAPGWFRRALQLDTELGRRGFLFTHSRTCSGTHGEAQPAGGGGEAEAGSRDDEGAASRGRRRAFPEAGGCVRVSWAQSPQLPAAAPSLYS